MRQPLRIGILAPVKNEADYLLDWIAYHRVLGVREFFLADNGGDDGTSELLVKLDAAGIIVRLDWTGRTAFQTALFNAAIPRLCRLVDIVAVIDCDEFLRPMGGHRSITSAVEKLFAAPDVSAVALNWAVYGSSGLEEADGRPVIERFVRRAPQEFVANHHVKTLLRPKSYSGSAVNPHCVPPKAGRYVNCRGEPLVWKDNYGITEQVCWDTMRIDHYVIKSRDEFLTKKQRRGRSDIAGWTYPEEYFEHMDRNEEFDPVGAKVLAESQVELWCLEKELEGPSISPTARMSHLFKRLRLGRAHGRSRIS